MGEKPEGGVMAKAVRGECPVCHKKKLVNHKEGTYENRTSSYTMAPHAWLATGDNTISCEGGEKGGLAPVELYSS
ncbi:hypothetical protein IID22_04655 [Patescibacteria group bacterium]|nr:hypothetical protein [Patescibacteria group bacterium]